jgi:two-component system sensor histidine kinase DctS
MAGQAPRGGYEARWVKADGTPLDVMIFEAPLVDAQGRQVGWMGSIVDVTARKQAEERELRRSEAMATQARLTTLGEVASALAHQLNQPLAAIAGYNAGALRSLERAGFPEPLVLDALRKLGEQANEAGRIVQRIRNFLTRRAPQRERCDPGEIVDSALKLLRRDLQREGIEVQVEHSATLPVVQADPVLMEQVLLNLLRNGADALAGQDAPRLRVSLGPAAGPGFLRVDIDDNGPGLGGLGIDQLSAPFHSTKPGSMGMGLAICRSVVEAHHGALEAGASPLGGARLSFTLPIAEAEVSA